MKRSELLKQLANRFPELSMQEVRQSVDTLLEAIAARLASGGRVEIRGFGSFRTLQRRGHLGHNPKTGLPLLIPTRRTLQFKAAAELRQRINPDVPATGIQHNAISGLRFMRQRPDRAQPAQRTELAA